MRNVIYIILSCLLFACQEKGQKQLEQIVEAWMGKEVFSPMTLHTLDLPKIQCRLFFLQQNTKSWCM